MGNMPIYKVKYKRTSIDKIFQNYFQTNLIESIRKSLIWYHCHLIIGINALDLICQNSNITLVTECNCFSVVINVFNGIRQSFLCISNKNTYLCFTKRFFSIVFYSSSYLSLNKLNIKTFPIISPYVQFQFVITINMMNFYCFLKCVFSHSMAKGVRYTSEFW